MPKRDLWGNLVLLLLLLQVAVVVVRCCGCGLFEYNEERVREDDYGGDVRTGFVRGSG